MQGRKNIQRMHNMVLLTNYILHVDAGESSNLGSSGIVAQSPTTEGNPSAASPLHRDVQVLYDDGVWYRGHITSFDIQTGNGQWYFMMMTKQHSLIKRNATFRWKTLTKDVALGELEPFRGPFPGSVRERFHRGEGRWQRLGKITHPPGACRRLACRERCRPGRTQTVSGSFLQVHIDVHARTRSNGHEDATVLSHAVWGRP